MRNEKWQNKSRESDQNKMMEVLWSREADQNKRRRIIFEVEKINNKLTNQFRKILQLQFLFDQIHYTSFCSFN